MPNRIIKESIRTSKNVNQMSDFQFRLFVYLITYVDDYGRGSADPVLLKGFVFPRLGRVRLADISQAMEQLANLGCLQLYEIDGEPYLCFPGWGDHQRIQTKRSKFPAPRSSTEAHRDPPPESNPNPKPNRESETEFMFDGDDGKSPPGMVQASPSGDSPVVELPLNDNTLYSILAEHIFEWEALYPAVDVLQALRQMRGWLLGNPKRRKTYSGVARFIHGWLSREQNSTCGAAQKESNKTSTPPTGNSFFDYE